MSFRKPKSPKIPEVKQAAPAPTPAAPEVRAAAADARERSRLRVGRSKSRRTTGVLSPLMISNASLKDVLG